MWRFTPKTPDRVIYCSVFKTYTQHDLVFSSKTQNAINKWYFGLFLSTTLVVGPKYHYLTEKSLYCHFLEKKIQNVTSKWNFMSCLQYWTKTQLEVVVFIWNTISSRVFLRKSKRNFKSCFEVTVGAIFPIGPHLP